ncbi:ABC transporter permease [Patulibacter brassicae]|uniref:ABC transporter permease n=1 Tax=Patulibacter brassicae TaxID=1705717 RepID=A0ABU4VFW5_9ACTN|nr:ABC transporter permease [Patulibacter brassicae]MDX8150716.1 ABC transporter permease [Patulibacter brassicae]
MSSVVQPPTLPGTPDQPVAPPPGKKQSTGIAAILEEIAAVLLMTFRAARMSVVPPFSWKGEFIEQTVLVIKRCFFPVVISTTFFGFGAPGLQGGNLVNVFGTVDRLGAFFVMASVREFAPWINGMVVAGVGGTAICADLGARKVRQELDALAVLGMDAVREIVVPRFLALGLVTALMNLIAIVFGVLGGWFAAVVVFGDTSAGYLATFSSNFTLPDLLGSIIKTSLFGFIIAAVCCYKGMTVKGGAEGVGRAVNQAVVMSFVGIWAFNFVFTTTLLAAFPETGNLH